MQPLSLSLNDIDLYSASAAHKPFSRMHQCVVQIALILDVQDASSVMIMSGGHQNTRRTLRKQTLKVHSRRYNNHHLSQ